MAVFHFDGWSVALRWASWGLEGAEVTGRPTIYFLESSICNYSMAAFTCVCHNPHISGVIFCGIAGGCRDVLDTWRLPQTASCSRPTSDRNISSQHRRSLWREHCHAQVPASAWETSPSWVDVGWMLDGDGNLKLRQKDDTINLVRYEISIDFRDSTRSLKGLLSVPALETCEHGNLPQLSLDSKLSIQKTSGSQPRNMAVFSKMSTSHRSSAGMMTLAVGAAGVMSAGFVAPGLELESESPGCRVFWFSDLYGLIFQDEIQRQNPVNWNSESWSISPHIL